MLGFMLDISRCKVLKKNEFFKFIDFLKFCGYDTFKLYIEHTYKFKNHKRVWRGSSALGANDIINIKNYCEKNSIELIGAINSFGHMQRWLMHKDYKHLASCPDGFIDPWNNFRKYGTVLIPNKNSLELMNELYDEFCPLFKSKFFNIGMDESFDLGLGKTEKMCNEKGKYNVFCDYLKKLCCLIEKKNLTPQFWADIILEDPDKAKEIPQNAVPIIWGYDKNHPFDKQCQIISSSCKNFMVAPGTSVWNSFTGRGENFQLNITNAITNAKKYGSSGLFVTSWGDGGNHQPFAITYLPCLISAYLWNNNLDKIDENIIKICTKKIDEYFSYSGLGNLLYEISFLDEYIFNNSLFHKIFFANEENLSKILENKNASFYMKKIEEISSFEKRVKLISGTKELEIISEELQVALSMSKASCYKAISYFEKNKDYKKYKSSIICSYKSSWLLRAKIGGLKESIKAIEDNF